MEKCRCNELERCYGDIIKLQDAVGRINKLYNMSREIHQQVDTVSKDTERSLTTNNLTQICWLVRNIDSNLENSIGNFLYIVNSYLNSLRNAYSAMKNEDILYHEQLRKETEQTEPEGRQY